MDEEYEITLMVKNKLEDCPCGCGNELMSVDRITIHDAEITFCKIKALTGV